MCFKPEEAILKWQASKNQLTNFVINISLTERDANIRLSKVWTAIARALIIWKSTSSDKIKWNFFQDVVVSVLLYKCTTWTLVKRIEKRVDGNCTRVLRVILNISWRQHPTKQQLYGHLPPILKHQSKTNITSGTLLQKQGRTHKWRSSVGFDT